ncbi:pectate lyase [Macrophomina phaseolina]|uniref:Pectate lyase n=1 Tax=Macrophomina phaseolina TaxID=35725 RepID=A0ABQ8G5J8_9PEZI|nr:pectate lyase [Macrophomina phaseolina]
MKYSTTLSIAASLAIANAGQLRSSGITRRQNGLSIPSSAGTETLSEPQYITGSFDGGLKTYGRGVDCSSGEGGEADAVFVLEDGASLSNAIIGADQIEGVYCLGACTIKNVWWEAVCEDALSIKGDGDATISGGGAQGAKDKVIQHNAVGTITIDGFTVSDFGKLYRSCGNCDGNTGGRNVIIKNVKAYSGSQLAGINSNLGDSATITDTCATDVDTPCAEYEGNSTGDEPTESGSGPSGACKYSDPLPSC